jgi:hypothetical protein
MVSPELAALVEGNAWTYGPNATALRILRLTRRIGADPEAVWEALLEQSPRMAPLGYWRAAYREGGRSLTELEGDFLERERLVVEHLEVRLGGSQKVLLAGHDREIDGLWAREGGHRLYRYLLLEGPSGVPPPGGFTERRGRPERPRFGPPFPFERLEEAVDWADALVLSGFMMHRQNLLGPPQLRPLLACARDQADVVLLSTTNERRLTLGEGSPRRYTEDFRPYLWQSSVTHLVSEWTSGAEGTSLGWLPMPAKVLRERFGEELFPA